MKLYPSCCTQIPSARVFCSCIPSYVVSCAVSGRICSGCKLSKCTQARPKSFSGNATVGYSAVDQWVRWKSTSGFPRLGLSLNLVHLRSSMALAGALILILGCFLLAGCGGFSAFTEPTKGSSRESLRTNLFAPETSRKKQSDLESEESDWLHLSRRGGSVLEKGAARYSQNSDPVASDAESVQSEKTLLYKRLYTVNAVKLDVGTLLYSLAEEAGMEISIQGGQSSLISLKVSNKPLSYVLDKICSQAKLRWHSKNNFIDIEPDIPYLKTYSVEYLNLSRTLKGSIGLATQVGSIALDVEGSSSNSGYANNSQVLIENESVHEFWESIEKDLSIILSSSQSGSPSISVNRDAGLISLRGTHLDHKVVDDYIHRLQKIADRQVLIEATVVEVSLSDSFQAGIDWRAEGPGLGVAQVFHGQPEISNGATTKLPAPSALLSAIHESDSVGRISATLDLLSQFGQVKILSRPQIIAINNQSAVLKVVDNKVYFTMTVERHSTEKGEDIRTASEIHTVPVGLVMHVTPYIGQDESVMLSVRPTISRILGFVNDPNPELANANVQNGVPEIQVREMESVLRVGNGQIVMIGGLMQSQRADQKEKIPWLADLPLVGNAFRRTSESARKTELLVFLQPTVMRDM